MGRRKRLCIISTEKDEHSTTEGGDIPTEVPVPTEEHNSKQGDPIPTEGGARKKVRGCTKKTETWNMSSSQKIVVAFNKLNKPIGDEGNELTQYIGTIVRMAENVGIDIHDWRMVPEHKKEDMYSMAKFVFHPAETVEIRSWIIGDMGKKWRTWKGLLKERAFDESLSIDEIVEKHCEIDKRVNPTQFKTLVTQWFDEEYKDMCKMKTASRKKMEEPHVSGTKSFARLADEEMPNRNYTVNQRSSESGFTCQGQPEESV